MGTLTTGRRIGATLLALMLGGAVVLLAGSVMLPSTKRAHFDFQHAREEAAQDADTAAAAATTSPAQ